MDLEAEDFIKALEKVTFLQQHHHKVMMAEHLLMDPQHQVFLTEAVVAEQAERHQQVIRVVALAQQIISQEVQ